MSKPAPTLIPIPADLVTPKSLKASVDQAEARSKQLPSSKPTAADRNAEPSNRLKRPIDDAGDSSEPSLKTNRAAEVHAPSVQPPPKRPKQRQTMFIPKKKVRS